jgi:hypothetical protein
MNNTIIEKYRSMVNHSYQCLIDAIKIMQFPLGCLGKDAHFLALRSNIFSVAISDATPIKTNNKGSRGVA